MSGGTGSGSGSGSTTYTGNQTTATNNQTTSGTSGSSSGSSTVANTNTYDPATTDALHAALTSDTYSKDAAIADSQSAMKYAVDQSLQVQNPGITSASRSSGGMNDTTTALLHNDANAKAAGAGATVQMNAISQYAADNASNINATTGAVNATKATTTTGSTTSANISNTLSDIIGSNSTAASGTGTSGSSSNKSGIGSVICSQLHLEGYLTKEVYDADSRFVRNNFHVTIVRGYQWWAVPYVRLMRKNRFAHALGVYLGMRWSKHYAAYHIGTEHHSLVGYIMTALGAPVCYLIGCCVKDPEFMSLWEGSPYADRS